MGSEKAGVLEVDEEMRRQPLCLQQEPFEC